MKTLVLAASLTTVVAAAFTSSAASARDGRIFFNQSPSKSYQSQPYRPHWGPGASHSPGNRGCHWVSTPTGTIRICR